MKIAFIGQPWEGALPPSSAIPIWNQQVANRLARTNEVIVYARRNDHQKAREYDSGVTYFLSKRTLDPWTNAAVNRIWGFLPVKHPVYASRLHYLPYILHVAKDLQRRKCDIAHIYNFSQFVPIIRAFNPDIKIVLNMRCDWLNLIDKKTIEKRLHHVDMVIGVADYITNNIRRRFPQKAHLCHTVYNGIDLETFAPDRSLQQRKSSPQRPRKLLYIGRISPEKGLHVLVEAFARVVEKYPAVQLELIGPPWAASLDVLRPLSTNGTIEELVQFYDGEGYIAHLRQRIGPSLASHVTFTDFIPNRELVPHFQHSDIFVFPSVLAEAFGRPIIEAMAVEVPVIATRIGGMVELVDHGKTGLLIKPNDVNALTDALLFLLKNEPIRRAMGKRGRKRAQELFSWECVVDSLQQKYQQLLSA